MTVYAGPNLVLKQLTRHERLRPKGVGRHASLAQQMCQCYRAVEIDQRSSRSWSSSRMSWSNGTIGRRGGGVPSRIRAGFSHPSRTPRSSNGVTLDRGGPISATGRSRSVMMIVSPAAARRTYSESLFFSLFRPTVRMPDKWPLEATFSIRPPTKEIGGAVHTPRVKHRWCRYVLAERGGRAL